MIRLLLFWLIAWAAYFLVMAAVWLDWMLDEMRRYRNGEKGHLPAEGVLSGLFQRSDGKG